MTLLNELIKEVRKSVIFVRAGTKFGTGFLISEDGLAVFRIVDIR